MLMIDIKITSKAYCHNRLGYDVVCSPGVTTDTSGAQGVVGLVIREQPQGWSVDSMRFYVPNVVTCEGVS